MDYCHFVGGVVGGCGSFPSSCLWVWGLRSWFFEPPPPRRFLRSAINQQQRAAANFAQFEIACLSYHLSPLILPPRFLPRPFSHIPWHFKRRRRIHPRLVIPPTARGEILFPLNQSSFPHISPFFGYLPSRKNLFPLVDEGRTTDVEGHGGHFSSPLLFYFPIFFAFTGCSEKRNLFFPSLFSHDLQNGRVSSCHDCYHCFFSLLESNMYCCVPQMCTSNGFEKSKRPLLQLGEGEIVHKAKQNTLGKKWRYFFQTTSWWILGERRTENSFSFQPTANKAADSTTKTIICENDVRRLTYNKIACPSSFFSVFPLLPASLAFI